MLSFDDEVSSPVLDEEGTRLQHPGLVCVV